MRIKWRARFLLHKRAAAGGGLYVRFRVSISGRPPVDIATGIQAAPECWDPAAGLLTGGADAGHANRILAEYQAAAAELFARFELVEKRPPSAAEVRAAFAPLSGRCPAEKPESEKPFSAVFDAYILEKSKESGWGDGTFRKHQTVRRHFIAATKDAPIGGITPETLQRFVDHLVRAGLRNTTVAKDYQFIRYFLRWARIKGHYGGNADLAFRPRLKGSDGRQSEIIYLTLAELAQLRACEIPASKRYLDQVRDVFLFCCYTSLRYSDARALRRSDIRGDVLHVVTKKTADALRIELNARARGILAKYPDLPGGAALPVISNQRYNGYLKELGRLAGLDAETRVVYYSGAERHDEFLPKFELLTSHVARRTFVVTALQLGIPAEVIIRWTGHSDFDAMKPYVAIVDELKRSEMKKFDAL